MKEHVPFWTVTGVLGLAALLLYWGVCSFRGGHEGEKEFPARIGEWVGEEVPYDATVIGVLSADQVIYRSFRRRGGERVTLFIAYYGSLERMDASHSPVVCFTGQGWRIESMEKREIDVSGQEGHRIRVNELVLEKMGSTMVTLFWYESAWRTSTNRGVQKLHLFLDRLRGRTDQNAFVRLTAVVPDRGSVKETGARLSAFVRDLYPVLRGFIRSDRAAPDTARVWPGRPARDSHRVPVRIWMADRMTTQSG